MPPNMAPIGGGGHATRPAPKAPPVATPRGVAIRSAPVYHAPAPASTHTSANPRGVAIAVPAHRAPTPGDRAAHASAVARATQGTPRGVQSLTALQPNANDRHALALHLMQLAHEHSASTGGAGARALSLGAVIAPQEAAARAAGIAKGATGVVSNLGGDIVDLPGSTLQGAETIGGAALHDLTHAPWEKGYHSQLADVGSAMAKSDPLFNLVTGHIGRAAQLAETHPLGAILDVTGVGGVAGRIAGAAARTGRLGEAAAAAAGARAPLELADGSIAARHASPNLFRNILLQAKDRRTAGLSPAKLNAHMGPITRELRRRADEHEMVAQDLETRYEAAARKKAASENLGPVQTERRVKRARATARRQAVSDLVHSNALVNPRNGSVFYAKGGGLTAEAQRLNAAGHDFVRVPLRDLGARGRSTQSVVIPRVLHERVKDHLVANEPPKLAARIFQQYTRTFRNTVLPFSTKWMLGNTGEAGFRAALHGVRPDHLTNVNPVLDEMRAGGLGHDADRLEAHALQGTHYSMNKRLDRELRLRARQDTNPALAHRVLHKAGRAYNVLPEKLFEANSAIEQQFAKAVLGKHMANTAARLKRDHPGITPENLRSEMAHEYAKPSVQADAGRYARHVLGKYSAFGPTSRTVIRTGAPFGPWYANSAKFIASLPVDHPLFTGASLAAERGTNPAWLKSHKDIKGLGGDLLSMPKVGTNGYRDIGRYLPFGAFTAGRGKPVSGAILADALPALFPQASDVVHNVLGQDAFGRGLLAPGRAHKYTPSGRISHAKEHPVGPDLWTALSSILSQSAGPTQLAHRVLVDRGATPYNTEKLWDLNPTMKNGTKGPLDFSTVLAGLNRVFNPARPTIVNPHSTSRKRKGSSAPSPYSGGSGSSGASPYGGGSGSSSSSPYG